jgi:hypothetical protein
LIAGLHSDIQSLVLRRCHVGLPSADRPLVGVYVLFTDDEVPNPDHARFDDGDRFQRCKILKTETAASKWSTPLTPVCAACAFTASIP